MVGSIAAEERHQKRRELASRSRTRQWADILAPYLFLAPFLLAFVTLFIGPALYSLLLSFQRYRGYGAATWVGLSNYQRVLGYHVFWTELANTAIYWLGHMFILLGLAYLLAVLIQSRLVRGKAFFKSLFFLPQVVAPVAAALVFQSVFAERVGLINNLLGVQIPWLQDDRLSKVAVIALLVWRGLGWWLVVFLAGLTSINPDLYDAAEIDGASAWQKLRYITTPLMRPTFLFAFVITTIQSFRLFTEPNVLVSAAAGGLAPPRIAPILNLLVGYLQGGQFGNAASVGWIIFLLMAVVSWVQFGLYNRSEGA